MNCSMPLLKKAFEKSGFENVDLTVRAKAVQENVEGWEAMLASLERHVIGAP